jgi:hypothetical protein
MEPRPEQLLRRLTISTARVRETAAEEEAPACASATAAVACARRTSAHAPRAVATPGPVARKRSFMRPGGVGAAWARCVGAQKTVNVGRKRALGDGDAAADDAAPLAGAPAALYPRNLADIAVFLRHRKRYARARRAPVPTPLC